MAQLREAVRLQLLDLSLRLRALVLPSHQPSPLCMFVSIAVNSGLLIWSFSTILSSSCHVTTSRWVSLGITNAIVNLVYVLSIHARVRYHVDRGIPQEISTWWLLLTEPTNIAFAVFTLWEIAWVAGAFHFASHAGGDICGHHLVAQSAFILMFLALGGLLYVLTFATEFLRPPAWRATAITNSQRARLVRWTLTPGTHLAAMPDVELSVLANSTVAAYRERPLRPQGHAAEDLLRVRLDLQSDPVGLQREEEAGVAHGGLSYETLFVPSQQMGRSMAMFSPGSDSGDGGAAAPADGSRVGVPLNAVTLAMNESRYHGERDLSATVAVGALRKRLEGSAGSDGVFPVDQRWSRSRGTLPVISREAETLESLAPPRGHCDSVGDEAAARSCGRRDISALGLRPEGEGAFTAAPSTSPPEAPLPPSSSPMVVLERPSSRRSPWEHHAGRQIVAPAELGGVEVAALGDVDVALGGSRAAADVAPPPRRFGSSAGPVTTWPPSPTPASPSQ